MIQTHMKQSKNFIVKRISLLFFVTRFNLQPTSDP
jgi:hypothetical protein